MINKFLTDIRVLKKAIATKKLVVFAGAGISIDAGIPGWGKLIDDIKKDLDLPEYENDYLKIPQIYYNERQEKEYIEKIREVLKHKRVKHNEIHDAIFDLSPEHVLTTNYDDLLEQVINKKSLPFSVVKKDADLPYSHNTKLLVKVHGDLESNDFVLKEDDYLNYSTNHPLIEAFIKSLFASKIVLFIGYSYNDYNLKQIIQNVRNILGSNFQNAYLISLDKEIHNSHVQYLKNKGINIINYFDSNYEENKAKINFIESFLKGNNIYNNDYYKELTNVSEKGQLLFNFLSFIKNYDDLKIKITDENVIIQTHKSLERFSELKILPQDFINNLYPFKSNHYEYENLIKNTSLLIKNEVLSNLFYERIDVVGNGEIVFKNKKSNDKDKNMLIDIVKKLNNSLIYSTLKEKKSGDFNITDEKSKKEIILNENSKCNCTSCKINRFEFNHSLKEVNSYVVSETSELGEDLQIAYINYKYGNYTHSFKMLEEIASKSWSIGKYITYYIAKYNMKSLRMLIKHFDEDLSKTNKEFIDLKIEEIDVDKLIFQIPYNSNEEFMLLKIIRDDKILNKGKIELNNLYDKVLKTYNGYKNSIYYNESGVYHYYSIYIELYKLINFYNLNYIVGDVFGDFKETIQKGLNSLIICHSISNDYHGRLQYLTSDFFKWTVTYHDSKKLLNQLEFVNKIDSLEFKENDIDKIIDYCINYFNSFYDKNSKYLLNNTYKNQLILNQLNKNSFENKMRNMFNNMMLILMSIEIPIKKKNSFIESMINFLEYEKFIYGDSIKYFRWFISKNGKLFTKNDCERLLKIVLDKYRKHDVYKTLDTISSISKENDFYLIDSKDFAINILSNYDYFDPNNDAVISLWIMSSDEIKEFLKRQIIIKLKASFNVNLYIEACFENIIDYNLFFEKYINHIKKNLDSNNNHTGYKIKNGKPKLDNFIFFNFIVLLYTLDVKSNDKRLLPLKGMSDFMDFFIFREKSDLSKFKVEWLLLIDRDFVYKELSKIKKIKKLIELQLKQNNNDQIAKIFFDFFA